MDAAGARVPVVRRDGTLVDYIDGRLLASHRGLGGGSPHCEVVVSALLLLPLKGNGRHLRRIPLSLAPVPRHGVVGTVWHLEDGVLGLRAAPAPGPAALEGESVQAEEPDAALNAVVADSDAMVGPLPDVEEVGGAAAVAAAEVADGDAMVGALPDFQEVGGAAAVAEAEVADGDAMVGALPDVHEAEEGPDVAEAQGQLDDVYSHMEEISVAVEHIGHRKAALQAAARVDTRARVECGKLGREQLRILAEYDELDTDAAALRLFLTSSGVQPTPQPDRLGIHPSHFLG
jgi:hypothetical protein